MVSEAVHTADPQKKRVKKALNKGPQEQELVGLVEMIFSIDLKPKVTPKSNSKKVQKK